MSRSCPRARENDPGERIVSMLTFLRLTSKQACHASCARSCGVRFPAG